MTHGKSDNELIRETRNAARYFTENRAVAWALLVATLLWGVYGYTAMPKRKDPLLPLHYVVALCPWPGAGAEKIEQLITRRIEEKIAENSKVDQITSIARNGVTIVEARIQESVVETGKEFDDLKVRLDSLKDLPEGSGPIEFLKDFGQTAALMLTVASPKVSRVDLALRAGEIDRAMTKARSGAGPGLRQSLVINFPAQLKTGSMERLRDLLAQAAVERSLAADIRLLSGPGFEGFDAQVPGASDPAQAKLAEFARQFVRERSAELHPDIWPPAIITDAREIDSKLKEVAGDKYSYRELDEFTELIKRTLQNVPQVSKVGRSGVLNEQVILEYSQQRLASFGTPPSLINQALGARNISLPGGAMEIEGKNLAIDPSGEFKDETEIGDVLLTTSSTGTPVYLRDVVNINRTYESPARFLNFITRRDHDGGWQRARAITLAVNMREGEQIGEFGESVDAALESVKSRLPDDLILARVSDQPQQVREDVGLFTRSLIEAVLLVVLVALIGFWEWRSAMLIAASIPLTLAMSFGMMRLLGLDLQQVSISSLILALGLLVDDPVVAGDAIKRELGEGHRPEIAAWLGPTKLANAIMFATMTNIVAYLPFLMLSGDMGRFLYALPVVLTITLIASRLVTLTFIPLLGSYLLRRGKKPERTLEEKRRRGFAGFYYRLGGFAIDHRWAVMAASLIFLMGGFYLFTKLKTQLFPDDNAYLSYVEVWLPEDASLSTTNETARQVETVIRDVAADYGKAHPDEEGKPREILESISTFVGGGGPRFWYSVGPEMMQLNYAQVIIRVKDKHDSQPMAIPLQKALSSTVAGAMVDVRQLKSGKNVGIPVSFRISGQEIGVLQNLAARAKNILREIPEADRIRDDWGASSVVAKLQIDPDRAALASLSNLDVAISSVGGLSGLPVTTLREGDKQIPVMVRMRREERAQLSDLENLYVYSIEGSQKTPLKQVASIEYKMSPEKIWRLNQFRTITVSCFPIPGALASQVFVAAQPKIDELIKTMPPGYRLETGGEQEERGKGFGELGVVMIVIVGGIFLMLVIQFKSAVKPLIVYAAIPFGIIGAIIGLAVTDTPFGFIAFLGIASLIGVIVSHIIVLFDFIEEMREQGRPLREALLDSGIARLRPVMITVGATVFGLIPLALNGGPLWEPLCYAQIGGLIIANYVTKLLVPALYAICVFDLKIVKWEGEKQRDGAQPAY